MATLTKDDGRRLAYVAWVVGVPWQNQGYASELRPAGDEVDGEQVWRIAESNTSPTGSPH